MSTVMNDEHVEIVLPTENAVGREVSRLYAMGLSLIPIAYRSKDPISDLLPHHRWEPYQKRRATEAELRQWFGAPDNIHAPPRNVGIVLGEVSGYVVVDADTKTGEDWVAEHCPPTPMMSRTRKGLHRYYRHPGSPVPNRNVSLTGPDGHDFDIKGDGGYVVGPPSVHEEGHVYTWVDETWASEDVPVFDLAWFATLETTRPATYTSKDDKVVAEFPTDKEGRKAVLQTIAKYIEKMKATQGNRDDTAFKVACVVRRGFNVPDELAIKVMEHWNKHHCNPRLDDKVLSEKLCSAKASGKQAYGSMLKKPKAKSDKKTDPHVELRDTLLAELVGEGWVCDPDGRLYAWDDEHGYYRPRSVSEIEERYAVAKVDAGLPSSVTNTRSVIGDLCMVLRSQTWKPDYADHRDQYIAFTNGIVRRANVLSGTTTAPSAPSRDVFVTYRVDVAWEPGTATTPIYDHLLPMFGGDTSIGKMDEYFLFARAVLLGDTTHQKCLFLYGPPGSGKSQLATMLSCLVPPKHRSSVSLDEMGRHDAPYYMAQLEHSLLNSAGEIGKPNRQAIQTFKRLTGGDEVSGRDLRESVRAFRSRANIVFTSNEKLGRGGDNTGAVEDRVRTLVIDTRIRDTSDDIKDFGRWFMREHSASFVAYAMSRTGTFGQAALYAEENKEGIEEDEYLEFAREHLKPGINFIHEATEQFNKTHTYRISEKRMATELVRVGFERPEKNRVYHAALGKKVSVLVGPDEMFAGREESEANDDIESLGFGYPRLVQDCS